MKMAFTGESELIYDKNLEKYRDHTFNFGKEKKVKRDSKIE